MALQSDNLMLLDISGIPRTIDATDEIEITNDLIVGGDLTVNGDIVSVGVRDVVVTDNFIDLSSGNIANARSGGLTVQVEGVAARSQALDANNGVEFQSIADSGGANARFKVDGVDFTTTPANAADRLSVNDIIQISGLSSAGENNGLFAVKSIANAASGGWVEIKNVNEQTDSTPFTQTEFESATEDVAGSLVGWGLSIGVIAISDGTLLDASNNTIAKGNFATAYAEDADDQGSGSSGFEYGDAAAVSLQEAYEEGNSIETKNTTNIAFNLASGNFTASGAGSVNLTPTAASSFTSGDALTLTGGAASTLSTTSGALSLDGNGGVNIQGNAGEVDITTSGAVDINSGAGSWDCSTLDIEGSGAATWTGASIAIDSTGGTVTLDAVGGGISLDGAGASNFTTSAGALSLDGNSGVNIQGNAAEVDITTSGAVDINSGAGSWDCSTLDIEGSGAATWTGASIAIDSTGGTVTLDAVGGGISLDGAGVSNFTTSSGALSLDGNGGVNIQGNAGEVDITTSGAVDINSGAGSWDCSTLDIEGSGAATWTGASVAIDSTGGTVTLDAVGGGISLDGAGVSNFTTSNGALTLNGAAGVNIAGNASEIDITSTGAVDINAGSGSFSVSGNDANDLQLILEADNSNGGALVELRAKSKIMIGDANVATAVIENVHWTEFQKSAGFIAPASVNLTQGDAVYLFNDGGTAKLGKADANSATDDFRIVIGLAAQTANANADCAVQSVMGTKMVTALTGLAAGNIGDPVYLHTTEGELSLTAPQSSGSTVFRVGYVADHNGGNACEIIFMPQFIAKRP